MKVGTSRFVVVAVITGLLLVAGSTTALAQSPNFTNFSTGQNLIKLNGNAAFAGSALRVASNLGSQTGTAFFNVQQPVQNGFTTTFVFQITNPSPAGDGLAFVIQNASTGANAIGFSGNGGALGYGDADGITTNNTGTGIANSIAIEFDTFANGWDMQNANHVAIQSCGTGNNTSHHNEPCVDGTTTNSTLSFVPVSSPTFVDGAPHTVTITYSPPSTPSGLGSLSVTLDSNAVATVSVNLSVLLNLTAGGAYVGFTSATGASVENHDILSWTYQAQAQPNQTTTFNFPNNNYVVTPAANQPPTTVQVTPIFVTPAACDALVQANPIFLAPTRVPPLTTQCFVYKNPDGSGIDKSVLYEVTCPSLPNGECTPFTADLGTTYDLSILSPNNLNFHPSNPFPGWLKGHGTDPNHPCANNNPPLFVSNQISFFNLSVNDPFTKGKSGGTGSCWVATFNTPNEDPTITITTPANGGNYAQDSTVNANYTCNAVSFTGATGPYLTTTQCAGTVASGAPIDTTLGTHTFTVNMTDSATDPATASSTYTVVAPADLAILNLAAPRAPVNSTLTYAIGVGDLGGATAVGVMVTDTFPTGLTPLSASGSNISCAVVNRRLTCTTTPFTCSVAASTVTCPVGPISPLSWSALNGATIQIKAKVTAATGTVLKDTATVSSSNTDSKLSNNSSTATTTVTAH